MALYLLNISVDTADPVSEAISENLSINDQESVVEIIVEQFLGYEDAIAEYDEHDPEDYQKKKVFKISFFPPPQEASPQETQWQSASKKPRFLHYASRLTHTSEDLDAPPPKAWFVFPFFPVPLLAIGQLFMLKKKTNQKCTSKLLWC